MGAWTRLRILRIRESQHGAVTLESALGIGALVGIATLLVQAVGVVVIHVQALTISYEALRIATASGDLRTRIWQAESFVKEQNQALQADFDVAGDEVVLKMHAALPIQLPGLPSSIEIQRSGLLIDRAIW